MHERVKKWKAFNFEKNKLHISKTIVTASYQTSQIRVTYEKILSIFLP